jgi:oxygen-independent coproporphyrinogen-3 oxidase
MNCTSKSGIYIHIPFCQAKCDYCDFYSITDLDLCPKFIQALKQEIAVYAQQSEFQTEYDSIYLGGGTPSLLALEDIENILDQIAKCFIIHPDSEITLEANPGTLGKEKLNGLQRLGVNRISIGVQSFIEQELKLLGRVHTVKQAESLLNQVKETGLAEMALDLIFAIPGQTLADWEFSIQRAVAYQPEHLSAYNLIVEEGTPFSIRQQNNSLQFFKPEQETDFYNLAENMLQACGYRHYEVSNYARSDRHLARHNIKYWQHTPYLSFGPSAHSFWPYRRWQNCKSVTGYMKSVLQGESAVVFQENLTAEQILNEHILLNLRLDQGIDLQQFNILFKCDFHDRFRHQIDLLTANGLAVLAPGRFTLTSRGMLLCDEILPQFSI